MPAGKHIFTSFKNIIFIFLVIFVLSACSKGNDKVISSENTIIERENHDSIENVISSEIVRVYSENHNSAGLKEKQIQTALQNLANKQFALWNSYKEVAPSILIDGDKKAEYFPPTYPDKPDNIRVTVGTKTYDFPGVYSEEAKKKYISAIDRCLVDKAFLNDDKEHQITYNGIQYYKPYYGGCMTGYIFNRFLSISPDGRYLVYSISGYELSAAYLLTVETGKSTYLGSVVVGVEWLQGDKPQMLYNKSSGFGDDNWEDGLFITEKNNFPKRSIMLSNWGEYVLQFHADDEYIYALMVKDENYRGDISSVYHLVVYSLESLQEVYRGVTSRAFSQKLLTEHKKIFPEDYNS